MRRASPGRLVLIGDEAERPYERPPLSKSYLMDKGGKATLYVHDEGWYQENSVELQLGRRVTSVDRTAHQVRLVDGDRLGYSKLLLATGAGLAVNNGVLVDTALRTDDPDIYAAGDVANAINPLYHARIRVEHWANALHGGPAAARSMLGQPVTYDRVVAGMHVNQWEEGIAPVQDLIRSSVPVDRHRLSDPTVPLRDSVECNAG